MPPPAYPKYFYEQGKQHTHIRSKCTHISLNHVLSPRFSTLGERVDDLRIEIVGRDLVHHAEVFADRRRVIHHDLLLELLDDALDDGRACGQHAGHPRSPR